MDQAFEWSRIGDIALGRQNLGEEMPVSVYRLLQFTMMDTLRERYGEEAADEVFRDAGFRAGVSFAQNILETTDSTDFSAFVADLQAKLKALKIGILRIEKADLATLTFTLTVSEDLDCSGLPVYGDTVCVYDEGFLAGILYSYTGKQFTVLETDCWATGARTCRFTAEPK